MHVVLIFVTNFVLDTDSLHKVVGPFESEDAANTYVARNTGKIEKEMMSLEDRAEDDNWSYSVQAVTGG